VDRWTYPHQELERAPHHLGAVSREQSFGLAGEKDGSPHESVFDVGSAESGN
jgi:hypothetical protein